MPASDIFSQRPFIVIWEATRACDLTCQHCRAEAFSNPSDNQLNFSEACALMDQVRQEFGQILFVITGGDPLRREDLYDLIQYGHNRGLRMAITPSATPLLNPNAIDNLQAAGIKRMALSLDGAQPMSHDQFRGFSGTFERTIEAFTYARSIGLETQMNTSVAEHNQQELPELFEIASYQDIALWSVFIVVPTGRADVNALMTPVAHEKVYQWLADKALDPKTPFDIKTTAGQPYYRVLAQKRSAGKAPQANSGLRAPAGVNDGKGFCFIDHEGNIQPSGFLPLTCGNIRTHNVGNIYRDHPTFRHLRNPHTLTGKCGRCEYNTICGGSRSRSYGLTGNPFASDETCLYQPKTIAKATMLS